MLFIKRKTIQAKDMIFNKTISLKMTTGQSVARPKLHPNKHHGYTWPGDYYFIKHADTLGSFLAGYFYLLFFLVCKWFSPN